MPSDELLFDGEFLKKLEYLHIVSKRVFGGQLRAERRTRKLGAGLEFADHRAYSPGDDFRHVDWTAYQRLDKLLLRLFEEEQDLRVYVFVDASASMTRGRPSKFDYAQRIAAALCYIGLAHLDRVSLFAYGDRLLAETPSERGRGRIFRMFRFLGTLTPGGPTNAREAFRSFCAQRRPRGVAVVISDFLDPAGFEPGLDMLRLFQHDVFVTHVVSPAEARPALRGDLRLVDAETGAARDLVMTPALLAAYGATFGRFCQEIATYCWKYKLGYVRTVTDTPFEDVILQAFRQGRFLA